MRVCCECVLCVCVCVCLSVCVCVTNAFSTMHENLIFIPPSCISHFLLYSSMSASIPFGILTFLTVVSLPFQRQTRAEWQIVFYVAAAIYAFGAIFYVIFASGVLQPWAMKNASEAVVEVQEPILLGVHNATEDKGMGERLMKNAP